LVEALKSHLEFREFFLTLYPSINANNSHNLIYYI